MNDVLGQYPPDDPASEDPFARIDDPIDEVDLVLDENDRPDDEQHDDEPAQNSASGWAGILEGDVLDLSGGFQIPIGPVPAKIIDQVRRIYLQSCALRNVPDWIQSFTEIDRIDLGGNLISSIPGWLANLTVRELDLSSNDIRTWPNGLESLHNLEFLDLSNNLLPEVPSEILNLTNLRCLVLSDNDIENLPEFLGTLYLEELYVSDNPIAELPEAWTGRIVRNLRVLDVSRTKLKTLPHSLGDAPDTIDLVRDDVNLRTPFDTMGTEDILTYLRSLPGDGIELYEAKLMLVGEGEVGKSSLISALRDEQFIAGRPTTHGIELAELQIPRSSYTGDFHFNTWDFGGQEVYRITHQFFFSRRSLYLLVWKPRSGQEESSVLGWCQRLALRLGTDASVILVATHADERRVELDWPALARRFKELLVGSVAVDSSSGVGMYELRREISKAAERLPQMGESISTSWLRARDEVLKLDATHITRTRFEVIAHSHGLDEAESTTLLRLLNDIGYLLHYPDDESLRDIVVLQPEWLTKAIGWILEDQATRDSGGVISHSRLTNLWSDRGYPSVFHAYFLRLMEKFDVSYRLPSGDASLIAQLVPYERPSVIWETAPTKPLRSLELRCAMHTEAPGLIAWLTVRYHADSVGIHWRRGVVLRSERYQSDALIQLDESKRTLRLLVRGPAPDYYFHVLRDGLENLLRLRWPGLRYKLDIPCGRAMEGGKQCTGRFPLPLLETLRSRGDASVVCHSCAEASSVEVLMTGIAPRGNPGHLLREIQHDLKNQARKLDYTVEQVSKVAGASRAILRLVSEEVSDCPRLFTLAPEGQQHGPSRHISIKDRWNVWLWCEHPGAEHRIDDPSYEVAITKEWIRRIAPYAGFVARLLKVVVPISIDALTVDAGGKLDQELSAQLKLLDTVVKAAPGGQAETLFGDESYPPRADESEARQFRQFLFEVDPARRFADLIRVVNPSGDILWVCDQHRQIYNPSLPRLPDPGTT